MTADKAYRRRAEARLREAVGKIDRMRHRARVAQGDHAREIRKRIEHLERRLDVARDAFRELCESEGEPLGELVDDFESAWQQVDRSLSALREGEQLPDEPRQ